MHVIDQPPHRTATGLESSILKVLAWFDLFHYPLPLSEIHFFLEQHCTQQELNAALQQLVEEQLVFYLDGFYSLQQNEQLAARRRAGNQRAKRLLTIAHRIGKILYHFPYVRGIGISGSLSKHFADEQSDIDFFIITSSNRLWIARTAMHLLKKLSYLAGRQHWFCMNYYIDEEALLIHEQNIFTATELITFMPVCGDETVARFLQANNWTAAYYPHYTIKAPLYPDAGKGYLVKRWVETLFNGRLGSRLENYLMRLTTRRWKQKETNHQLNARGMRIGLSAGKHFSRPNPGYFQKNILEQFQRKWEALLEKRGALQPADR